MTVGMLKKSLRGIPDNAEIRLTDDVIYCEVKPTQSNVAHLYFADKVNECDEYQFEFSSSIKDKSKVVAVELTGYINEY